MGKCIGIDLGTTYSVVAYIDDNSTPRIIQNSNGTYLTPSTILFDKNGAIVGDAAKSESFLEPNNYVSLIKRHMGSRSYKYTDAFGNSYSPETLSSIILKRLVMDAEEALGDSVDGVVISVPAYFNDSERKATKDAATIAGINVLAIINEPTAAALSYGIDKGDETAKTIAVYDLGGGTFDICIMRFTGSNIETLATKGDPQLGGSDFDNEIINYVKAEALKKGINITADKAAMQSLILAAEDAKKKLSQESKSKAKIALSVNGNHVSVEILKDTFESLIQNRVYQTIVLLENALDHAQITNKDLDKILLVGGSTRIPLIKRMIEEGIGIIPSADIHPDEAVAIGAAYHAVEQAKKRNEGITENKIVIPEVGHEYTFIDRTAHSIGIVAYNEEEEKDYNAIILPYNTVVPAQAEEVFYTLVDNQKTLVVRVTQGESEELEYVSEIGRSEIQLKSKPSNSPIRVAISCDQDSIIHVRIVDDEDNESLGEFPIDRFNNLTKEDIAEQRVRIGKLNIGDE